MNKLMEVGFFEKWVGGRSQNREESEEEKRKDLLIWDFGIREGGERDVKEKQWGECL